MQMILKSISLLFLPTALVLLLMACGGGNQPSPDIEATAEAMAKAMVAATAQVAPTATAVPPAPTTSSGSAGGERLDYLSNSLYYLSSVTQQEAQRLLDYLVHEEFFPAESEVALELRKEGGAYEVRIPLKEGIDPNDTYISDIFKGVACELEAYVFTGSIVNWIAVGILLKTSSNVTCA